MFLEAVTSDQKEARFVASKLLGVLITDQPKLQAYLSEEHTGSALHVIKIKSRRASVLNRLFPRTLVVLKSEYGLMHYRRILVEYPGLWETLMKAVKLAAGYGFQIEKSESCLRLESLTQAS